MNATRPSFVCASCARSLRAQTRTFASTARTREDARSGVPDEGLPRWRQTPAAMKMPIRLRPRPKGPVWRVNASEEVLDRAFDEFVGHVGGRMKGSELLDAETKVCASRMILSSIAGVLQKLTRIHHQWTALTHKSFDQGRQGFNDRLAFLGKRIVDWQTSVSLLSAPTNPALELPEEDVYKHPALDGLENITSLTKHKILDKYRLSRLAISYNIDKAVRWKPKKTDNLAMSGQDVVLAHTLYSMVGALAMKQGGDVAARTVKERILQPLGIR